MPRYSEELIEEVRSRSDVVDIIGQYVGLKKKGNTYFGLCPFHNEKTGSFSVSPHKQMYYCFGCGAGGNVFTFLMNYENMSFPEALQMLADRAGIELPKEEMSKEERVRQDKRSQILEINKKAAGYFYSLLRSPHGEHALRYFEGRALSNETMQKFGLGYSDKFSDDLYKYLRSEGYTDEILKESGLVTIDERGGKDKFWNRAMFPIMDANNKVVAFGGRVMGDGEPKYLNSPETLIFNKSKTLYGLYLARRTRRKQMILCEGYMDVIALHQAGFDNAVASLGTALTSGHAGMLKRYTDEVYLSYDSDGAGQKAALRAIPILKEAGITCKIINMSPHKDPDEFIKALGADAYQERIDKAENSFMYEIRQMEKDYDMHDPEGKSKFQTAVADRLMEFTEELERDNYIRAVAEHYMIGFEQLKSLVAHEAARGGIVKKPSSELKKPGQNRANKALDGKKTSERLLLTWICENPGIYNMVSGYIDANDFSEGTYRKVAIELFRQLNDGEQLNPSRIVNMFEEDEEQREVARIFNTSVDNMDTPEAREKALRETVVRIKENSVERNKANLGASGPEGAKKLMEDMKMLQELKRTKFPLV